VATILVVPLLQRSFFFDDAFMFYRYAVNLRNGLGIAWNPDGIATYGLTSQLWLLFVLPFTFLPFEAQPALRLASCLTGAAAFIVMGVTVARHATSLFLRSPAVAIACVALPLLAVGAFRLNLASGMDTMVSLLANAVLVCLLHAWLARPDRAGAFAVGLSAFVAVLARPDSGLCGLAVPFLAWALLSEKRRLDHLVGLIVLPALLVGVELVVCRWYYGVPLPLGFYAKSAHSYEGFQSLESGVRYIFEFSTCCLLYLAALLVTVRREHLPRLAAFLLPVAATFAYLLTVRQIMGFGGRFYIPYLPYLIVPALLIADGAMARDPRRTVIRTGLVLVALCLVYVGARPYWLRWSEAYARSRLDPAIALPTLDTAAGGPAIIPGLDILPVVVDDIVAHLPAGATMAASEVGYLGVRMHGTLIDLVGLNDTAIGMRGFDMPSFLARKPDLVWFPHGDYTGLRRQILSDTSFRQQYVIILGFDFGMAIRRDSPYRAQIDSLAQAAWKKLYPSYSMDDYVVRN
jgi:hypothetical protein